VRPPSAVLLSRLVDGVAIPGRRWAEAVPDQNLRYGSGVELGYARVSTLKQDLDRQIDALEQTGIPRKRIYVDKKSGATTDRPGLREVIAYAREGDVIVVHTLDRLGRTVRDTLNLIHELSERKVGVRNLADPIKVPGRSDGAARGRPAGSVRADGADIRDGARRARPGGRDGEGSSCQSAGAG